MDWQPIQGESHLYPTEAGRGSSNPIKKKVFKRVREMDGGINFIMFTRHFICMASFIHKDNTIIINSDQI